MVSRLKRVRFGPVLLPSRLARGRYEELSEQDSTALYTLLKLTRGEHREARGKTRENKKGRGKTDARTRSVLIPYPDLPV
jgi:23S rRNA pseudouridine2605 synthase